MEYANILHSVEGAVSRVTVNRPDKLNALNRDTVKEITHVFTHLDEDTRAVVLTGSGEKAFVAGADIAELARMTPVGAKEVSRSGQEMCAAIEECPVPVIAAVNGFALGGGLEVALAAHIRIASTTAKLGLPEVTLGIIPGYGGTQRLLRLVGTGRALEMMLSGAMIDAEEAYRLGLVNRVVPAEELARTAMDLAERIAKNGPIAVRYALEATRRGAGSTRVDGLAIEQALFGLVSATSDMKEGLSAFLEKRKAEFRGE